MIRVAVCDNKYEVIIDLEKPATDTSPRFYATRYGRLWRDLTGDNLIFHLAMDLHEARKESEKEAGLNGNNSKD